MIFLPDIGGDVLYARKIVSQLKLQRGVYGLCLDSEMLENLSDCTLQGLAQRFAADLHASGLPEPFHLVGHCFAGFLAFETACQLATVNAQVGVVALLDCSLPSRFYAGWRYQLMAALRRLKHRQRDLLKKAPFVRSDGDPSLHLYEPGFIHLDLSKHPESYRHIIRHLFRAMLDYEPGHYSGHLTLFRAMDRRGLAVAPKDLGWKPYAKGGVAVIQLAGNYNDIVQDDGAVVQLAEQLDPILGATEHRTRAVPSAAEIGVVPD